MIEVVGDIGVSSQKIERICQELGLKDLKLQVRVGESPVLSVQGNQTGYTIAAPRGHMLFRGLLLLSSQLKAEKTEVAIQEQPFYRDLGFMADASRNAVPTVATAKKMIGILAQMGYSSFQLYMEDTYQLRDEPYFGYLRGAYETAELQEIEAEANQYGMDFVPCIQTLAHLHSFVKWNRESIQRALDIDDILLIGSERTYEIIDKMFEALSHLKTRRINIGMDEAYQVGLGQYLRHHGFQNRSLLMCQHLERVLDIADKYGFSCSMWSDMFFQLMSTNNHYGGDLTIDEEVRTYMEKLKERVTLIYWDYYQTTEEGYDKNFVNHEKLGKDIAFAGGAWKWIGFTPDNTFSLHIAKMAHASSKRHGVKDVTITAWGDNGGETSIFAVLPSLQAWAELMYTDSYERLSDHLEAITGVSQEDFMKVDMANLTPSNPHSQGDLKYSGFNPNRYMLYQDVLCPLLDQHMDVEADSHYLTEASLLLGEIAERSSQFSLLFQVQSLLCRLNADKILVTQTIRQAYKAGDKMALADACHQLARLIKQLDQFRTVYSRQWLAENKVFGLDTIDIRLGGLKARMERAISRIQDYLAGDIEGIDELEVDILPYTDGYPDRNYMARPANQWQNLATASTIYTT